MLCLPIYNREILQKLSTKVGVQRHCLRRDGYFLGTVLSSTRPPSIDSIWREAVCQPAASTANGASPFILFHICKEIFIPLRASRAWREYGRSDDEQNAPGVCVCVGVSSILQAPLECCTRERPTHSHRGLTRKSPQAVRQYLRGIDKSTQPTI